MLCIYVVFLLSLIRQNESQEERGCKTYLPTF